MTLHSLTPLIIPMFHLFVHYPHLPPDYYIDVSIDNHMICDANINLGSVDNMFNMLGGNVDNFASLGYFNGYNASLDLYCMCLVYAPRKIMWNTFFDFSCNFLLYLV